MQLSKLTLPMVVAATLLFSCDGGAAARMDVGADAAGPRMKRMALAETATPEADATKPAVARKLIRTATMHLRAADTEKTAKSIQALVASLGGFIGGLDADRRAGPLTYHLTIRVPEASFDRTMSDIRALATDVVRENVRTADVTEQYVDLEGRLRALGLTATELEKLLAESRERERDVDAIMQIYRELTTVRQEREALQGKFNALQQRVQLATITIHLGPDETARPVVSGSWRPGDTAHEATRILVGICQALGDAAIFLAIVVAPLAALALFLFFAARRIRRSAASRSTA